MDIMCAINYLDEPMDNNEALHYLLENTGNIISIGYGTYIINRGDYFASCFMDDTETKLTLLDLVFIFFNNEDYVWVKGKLKKTDNLKEIQQSVVDYLEELNKVALKNEELSFLKKEELYDMLLFHMIAMYHYFNNDCKNLTIDVNMGNSKHSENN